MRSTALLLTVLLVACDDTPKVQPIDEAAPHTVGEFLREGGSGVESIFEYGRDFGSSGEHFHMFIEAGHREGDEGYVATELVLAELYRPLIGDSIWTPVHRCTGTATREGSPEGRRWTLELGGPAECARWSGVFVHSAPWASPSAARAPEPTEPTEPSEPSAPAELVVPAPSTPFARALADAAALTPGEAACPIRLRRPSEAATAGVSPGEAALREQDSYAASGEAFGVVRATSGQTAPADPDSADRYQALYVRTVNRQPRVEGMGFFAGESRGRAFLVDTREGRVVCVGDIRATNGDAIQAPRGDARRAEMWLNIQLLLAEERAIATSLRVPGS